MILFSNMTALKIFMVDARNPVGSCDLLLDPGGTVRRAILFLDDDGNSHMSFALMLALDFDIYLIDEGMPQTTDVEFNKKAGSILQERLETTTIIMVSHQPKTLEKFVRSAAVLLDGHLHMFDTLEEAKQLYDYQTQG